MWLVQLYQCHSEILKYSDQSPYYLHSTQRYQVDRSAVVGKEVMASDLPKDESNSGVLMESMIM